MSCKTQAITLSDDHRHEVTVNPESLQVTSHVYLKPVHSTEPLEKEVVLRRIRQRTDAKNNKVPVCKAKWVDDAFAAP
ncbi:hypothetical protein RJ639_029624 [Escallonia herrerae]|uniref:Uncharacterized protein n=1 Tax=Escallonia herrerae TaxID=1293975 RepID=A0AA88X9S8_9ASTE|nr:hypothetical protein RJ639_029624 [Escallonia herrerae]